VPWARINPLGQLVGALILFGGLGFLPGFVLSWLLKKWDLLRVPREVELAGLDYAAVMTVTREDDDLRAARAAGWSGSHIHAEQFAAPPVGAPFDVHLARSHLTVHAPPERSLLEAIEAAGVDAPYLCRGGACGQCETDVLALDGELIHNDHWLSDEDKRSGKKIMPCVSRARGTRLVLDR
jgi:ferredoxin